MIPITFPLTDHRDAPCSYYCLSVAVIIVTSSHWAVLNTWLWWSYLTSWQSPGVGTGTPLYRWNNWGPERWAHLPKSSLPNERGWRLSSSPGFCALGDLGCWHKTLAGLGSLWEKREIFGYSSDDGAAFEPRTICSRINLDSSWCVKRTITIQNDYHSISDCPLICFHCSHHMHGKLPREARHLAHLRSFAITPLFLRIFSQSLESQRLQKNERKCQEYYIYKWVKPEKNH